MKLNTLEQRTQALKWWDKLPYKTRVSYLNEGETLFTVKIDNIVKYHKAAAKGGN